MTSSSRETDSEPGFKFWGGGPIPPFPEPQQACQPALPCAQGVCAHTGTARPLRVPADACADLTPAAQSQRSGGAGASVDLPGPPHPHLHCVLGTWRRGWLSPPPHTNTSVLNLQSLHFPIRRPHWLFQKDLQAPSHGSMFFIQQTFMGTRSRPGTQDTQVLPGLWGRQAQVWWPQGTEAGTRAIRPAVVLEKAGSEPSKVRAASVQWGRQVA